MPFAPAIRHPPPPASMPFPYCECNRTLGTLPFTFDSMPVVKKSGANKLYCMRLTAGECIDPANKCCNQALAKVEWWSKAVCRRSVKSVYMDGVKVDQQWDPVPEAPTMAVFKIPQINLPRSAVPAAGIEVCIELVATEQCPTLATFCTRGDRGSCTYAMFNDPDKDCCPIGSFAAASRRPPPPSPSPPEPPSPEPPRMPIAPAIRHPPPPASLPFPYCECNRTLGTLPFTFDSMPVVKKSGANKLYCMRLTAGECIDPANKCCNQALAKVEWWSKAVCRRSVKSVYMDGVKVDQQWSPVPESPTMAVFKIPQINLPRSAVPAAGIEVCIELVATEQCPTLATFCTRGDRGSCTYAMFNAPDKNCCPIGSFATASR
ncbi:Sulfated surface glycoprotein, partial [Tetrabaena socialis]